MDRQKNKKFRWGQMQFNLVNNQEQVVQLYSLSGVAWRGVAWRGVAQHGVALHGVSLRVYQYFGGGGGLQHLQHGRVLSPCGAFPGHLRAVLAVSGSFVH